MGFRAWWCLAGKSETGLAQNGWGHGSTERRLDVDARPSMPLFLWYFAEKVPNPLNESFVYSFLYLCLYPDYAQPLTFSIFAVFVVYVIYSAHRLG